MQHTNHIFGFFTVLLFLAVDDSLPFGETENDSGSEAVSSDVRALEKGLLRTELKANGALNDMEKGFPQLSGVIGSNLRLAKLLAFDINNKVNETLLRVNTIKDNVNKTAKGKLDTVQKAASIVDVLEEQVGADEIRNASKVLHLRLPHNPSFRNNPAYRQVLKQNDIITKLDGAKIIAVDKAERKYDQVEKAGEKVSQEVGEVEEEVASAEKEIENDAEAELEDEKIAQEKLEEAAKLNVRAIRHTAKSLNRIRKLLHELENDERVLKEMQI